MVGDVAARGLAVQPFADVALGAARGARHLLAGDRAARPPSPCRGRACGRCRSSGRRSRRRARETALPTSASSAAGSSVCLSSAIVGSLSWRRPAVPRTIAIAGRANECETGPKRSGSVRSGKLGQAAAEAGPGRHRRHSRRRPRHPERDLRRAAEPRLARRARGRARSSAVPGRAPRRDRRSGAARQRASPCRCTAPWRAGPATW